MLLLGALLALLAAGLWMYALIDVLLTPRRDCRRPGKAAWLAIAGLLFVPGAVAWLWFGRPLGAGGRHRPRLSPGSLRLPAQRRDPVGLDAEAALRRHPAGRGREDWVAEATLQDLAGTAQEVPLTRWPAGPDDDPDFLRYLDQVIQDIRETGNGA
jgi:Phospholipase_D-nuclease N-terminal